MAEVKNVKKVSLEEQWKEVNNKKMENWQAKKSVHHTVIHNQKIPFEKSALSRQKQIKDESVSFLTEAGAYPQLPTQPNFFILFKLIQQSNMVILSCLKKKNQNLNMRKKSSVYY